MKNRYSEKYEVLKAHAEHLKKYTISVLGQEEVYMVKYTRSPEGFPEGEA